MLLLALLAYGRLLLNPDIHVACPENDTWNFPIRWFALSSLRDGKIPLWNSLSGLGIPWLATWQTETYYPTAPFFDCFGANFWNYSGVLHLLVFALGLYRFLRLSGVRLAWSFLAAATGLLNGCAFNHLGSTSPTDTMAWIPWLMVATRGIWGSRPWAGLKFSAAFCLQIFGGYPQIILYTLAACFAYAWFLGGWRSMRSLTLPILGGALISSCQWIPSMEYFFLHSVRLPAVQDNPDFFLPLQNLKTFWDFNALSQGQVPDYVASPTYFYFNFYSGFIPLVVLPLGLLRMRNLPPVSRFFLVGFAGWILWSLGFFLWPLGLLNIPFPAFFEPAKCWVLADVFELVALGLLLENFRIKNNGLIATIVAAGTLNLMVPIWSHPYERNLVPPNPVLAGEARKIRDHMGSNRVLILPDSKQHAALYTPLPDPTLKPLFKRFVPNNNLLVSIPVPNFYGSTWPSWGALNAAGYFHYGYPYDKGNLLDLLGIGLIYLPSDHLPERYKKIHSEDGWTLWENPGSLGEGFLFTGIPIQGTRKQAFEAFASDTAHPLRTLYLNREPASLAPKRFTEPNPTSGWLRKFRQQDKGFYVFTQNAIPGWRAWLDGTPRDIFLADGVFQSVEITPGSHWLKLAYEPASFRFGQFLSLLTVAGIFGWLGLRKKGLISTTASGGQAQERTGV